MPKISVLIPIYKTKSEHLRATIKRTLKQTDAYIFLQFLLLLILLRMNSQFHKQRHHHKSSYFYFTSTDFPSLICFTIASDWKIPSSSTNISPTEP